MYITSTSFPQIKRYYNKYKSLFQTDNKRYAPRLVLEFHGNSSHNATYAQSAAAAHTNVFDNTWRRMEAIQKENRMLALFGIDPRLRYETVAGINTSAAPTAPMPIAQKTPPPHLNYVTSVSFHYKPVVYGDRKLLTQYLRTKILINNSSRRLTDTDIETLALGLNFVLHSDFAPGCPMEELRASNDRWVIGINRSINFARNQEHRILEKGLAAVNQPRGVLESSGRLERDEDDWDPFERSENEWTKQPQFLELNNKLKRATFGSASVDLHENVRQPLYDSAQTLGADLGIHTINADKGGATIIIDTVDYDREADRQLGDKKTYTELDKANYDVGLTETADIVKRLADDFLRGGHITKSEHSVFHAKLKDLEGSYIYFLPKIHKAFNEKVNAFPGRPIAATFMCVIHTLDKYITELTKPLLAIIPGSLIDTTDLLVKLPIGPLPKKARLATSDVNSLYPNIPWRDGIDAATAFYAEHISFLRKHNRENGLLPPLPLIAFHDAITAVITRSFITFKGRRFFRQISGTSMGTCISVYLANTYMYQLTRRHIPHGINRVALERPNWLIFFERYIDDLILIVDECTKEDIANFFRGISNDTISYETTEPAISTPALDVTLSICQDSLKIITEPYSKPTSKPTFLHASSMHPKHSIDSLPFAQFLRLKRISSNNEIFQRHACTHTESFLLRGYSARTIQKALAKANAIPRSDLLLRRPKRDVEMKSVANSFKYIVKYSEDGHWNLVRSTLQEMHSSALSFYQSRIINETGEGRTEAATAVRILEERPFTLVFSVHNSTKDALTRNYKRPNDKKKPKDNLAEKRKQRN